MHTYIHACVYKQILSRPSHWVVGQSCSGADFRPDPRLRWFFLHPPPGDLFLVPRSRWFSHLNSFKSICTHQCSIQLAGSWMETLRFHAIMPGWVNFRCGLYFNVLLKMCLSFFVAWIFTFRLCSFSFFLFWIFSFCTFIGSYNFLSMLRMLVIACLYGNMYKSASSFRRSLLPSVRPRNLEISMRWIAQTW